MFGRNIMDMELVQKLGNVYTALYGVEKHTRELRNGSTQGITNLVDEIENINTGIRVAKPHDLKFLKGGNTRLSSDR